ncbi:hypothetical protein EOD39_5435 [Acipenser ruthenus]|uniref:Uncharacterized protein n=1 Tax=Acipenser ruthenus TaxID=7906 RepID=A0A444UE23_ACIRT|nr:hypothetical protein EOD39_5435 [Acipenser ruthenus]
MGLRSASAARWRTRATATPGMPPFTPFQLGYPGPTAAVEWRGCYVNMVIPGKKEYLCLCEVEVYAVPSNKDCCSKGCIQNNSN